MDHFAWPAEFFEGVRLFNEEHFFETHEVWEEVWRAAPREQRDLYQGMIHLTVALYQARRANWRAAHSQLRRAARRLAAFEPTAGGLEISVLRASVAHAVARLEAGRGDIHYPKIHIPAPPAE